MGRAHRAGLLRGLALLGIFGALMSFAFIFSALHAAEANPAPTDDALIHCATSGR